MSLFCGKRICLTEELCGWGGMTGTSTVTYCWGRRVLAKLAQVLPGSSGRPSATPGDHLLHRPGPGSLSSTGVSLSNSVSVCHCLTSLHCHSHACGKTVQPQEWMPQSGLSQVLVGSDPALSPVTGLHHWACLQLAPPALHLHAPA